VPDFKYLDASTLPFITKLPGNVAKMPIGCGGCKFHGVKYLFVPHTAKHINEITEYRCCSGAAGNVQGGGGSPLPDVTGSVNSGEFNVLEAIGAIMTA
jgi:hypothetical protein